MISAELLRELIAYDALSGVFLWRKRDRRHFTSNAQFLNWNGRYPGTVAGRLGDKGYRAIAILDRLYAAHRLAWLYTYGTWPLQQIDHLNGDRDDNRIVNLRDVSGSENAKNRRVHFGSKTGHIGVTEYPFQGSMKYVARIRCNGHLHHLGYFGSIAEAAKAHDAASVRLGFHANHGTPPKTKRRLQSRGFQ